MNDVTPDDTAARRARMTVRRFASAAEADRHDLEFWMQMSAADRVALVWTLTEEQWRLSGKWSDEPGLCRSVASIRRR